MLAGQVRDPGCAVSLSAAGLALASTAGAYTRGFRVVNLSGSPLLLEDAGCAGGVCRDAGNPPSYSRAMSPAARKMGGSECDIRPWVSEASSGHPK